MSGVDAGRLNRRLDLDAPDQIDNGRGGRHPNPATGGWRSLGRVWAEVIALRGDEAVRQSVERSIQLWRVTIRTRSDVTTKHRLRWGAIIMNIRAVAPNDEGDCLVMTCESGAPG